jgi:hypothetical protein
VTALAEILALACPQGYVRIFADEGPPMAALLGRLVGAQRAGPAAGVPLGCLVRLQRAFNPEHMAPDPGRAGPACCPLVSARWRRSPLPATVALPWLAPSWPVGLAFGWILALAWGKIWAWGRL